MTQQIKGFLEIDHDRGVIYFHDKSRTILRICSLPKPIPVIKDIGDFLEITHMFGASWESKK